MEERPKPSFKEGQTVVYPGHGAMRILRIIQFSEEGGMAYVLSRPNTEIMIPVANEKLVGLRKLSDPAQVRRATECFRSGSIEIIWDYRERMDANRERISRGSLMDLAEALRMINLVREEKALSVSETELYRKAATAFREEVKAVWGEEETKKILNGFL